MIHAHINNVVDKKVIGYECGTRQAFDQRHGGDPLWVFLDRPVIVHEVNTAKFLTYPTRYRITSDGGLGIIS